jgi:hypothetical protein
VVQQPMMGWRIYTCSMEVSILPCCCSHALDKPQTEYEQWVNVAWWLKRFI